MSVPLISTTAFAGIPDVIEAMEGHRAVHLAFDGTGMPLSLAMEPGLYVPQHAFIKVLEHAARYTGNKHFGIHLTKHLSISRWGPFGSYILQSDDLSEAMARTKAILKYHASMLSFNAQIYNNEVIFTYKIPTHGVIGYRHFVVGAARIIMSIAEAFLGTGTAPLKVELDIPKISDWTAYEELFMCPVEFNRPRLSIAYLWQPPRAVRRLLNPAELLTIADLHRALQREVPTDIPAIVKELIRAKLYGGAISIEEVSSQLGIGVRTLQRQLGSQNLIFRDLVLQVRAERAMELLKDSNATITDIAMTLGYSSSAHFTRAFKQIVGYAPSEIRVK